MRDEIDSLEYVFSVGGGEATMDFGAVFTLLTVWDAETCVELLEPDRPTYVLGPAPMLIDLARNPGQRAVASIVPREPKQELRLEDVTGFLDEKGLSRTKWPEAMEMVDEFATTSTGKVMRYNLRERAEQLRPQR